MNVGTSSGDPETVRVRFPPEVLERIDESVRTEEYATRGEVVEEAIRRAAEE